MSATPSISPTFSETPLVRYQLVLKVFDASGREVRTLFAGQVPGPPSELQLSASSFEAGGPPLLIRSAAGDWQLSWDGVAADGFRAYPGLYHLQAQYQEFGKDALEVRGASVGLLWKGAGVAASAVLGPNPSTHFVRLHWKPVAGYTIRAKVYNVPGELIRVIVADSARGFADWKLDTASGAESSSGVYIWALEIIDGRGEVVERGFQKHVIVRKP